MDDKTFIYNFLDKNFTVGFDVDKPIITDIYTDKKLREIDFHTLVAKIIGTYVTQDGTISRQVASNWLDEAIQKIGLRVDTYLYNCRVVHASDGWIVVDDKDKEVTFESLIRLLEGVQSYNEISEYFDQWYNKKVLAAVDELMKTY
jgi:hypothetical protein